MAEAHGPDRGQSTLNQQSLADGRHAPKLDISGNPVPPLKPRYSEERRRQRCDKTGHSKAFCPTYDGNSGSPSLPHNYGNLPAGLRLSSSRTPTTANKILTHKSRIMTTEEKLLESNRPPQLAYRSRSPHVSRRSRSPRGRRSRSPRGPARSRQDHLRHGDEPHALPVFSLTSLGSKEGCVPYRDICSEKPDGPCNHPSTHPTKLPANEKRRKDNEFPDAMHNIKTGYTLDTWKVACKQADTFLGTLKMIGAPACHEGGTGERMSVDNDVSPWPILSGDKSLGAEPFGGKVCSDKLFDGAAASERWALAPFELERATKDVQSGKYDPLVLKLFEHRVNPRLSRIQRVTAADMLDGT